MNINWLFENMIVKKGGLQYSNVRINSFLKLVYTYLQRHYFCE